MMLRARAVSRPSWSLPSVASAVIVLVAEPRAEACAEPAAEAVAEADVDAETVAPVDVEADAAPAEADAADAADAEASARTVADWQDALLRPPLVPPAELLACRDVRRDALCELPERLSVV